MMAETNAGLPQEFVPMIERFDRAYPLAGHSSALSGWA